MLEQLGAQQDPAIAIALAKRLGRGVEQRQRLRALTGLVERVGKLALGPHIGLARGHADRFAIERHCLAVPAEPGQRIGDAQPVGGGVGQVQRVARGAQLAFGVKRRHCPGPGGTHMAVLAQAGQDLDQEIGDGAEHGQEDQRGQPHRVAAAPHQMDDARHLQPDDQQIGHQAPAPSGVEAIGSPLGSGAGRHHSISTSTTAIMPSPAVT